jgi:2-dehydropantoate 2-reductase
MRVRPSRRNADVVLIGRWPEQVAALRRDGLTLIQPDGRRQQQPLSVATSTDGVDGVDLALLLVKSHQTARAAQQAAAVLAPGGLVLTLQNGLGNRELIAAVVGEARVALGVTTQGAAMVRPGVVRRAGYGQTHLGAPPHLEHSLTAVAHLLTGAGLETHLAGNVDSLIWGKLAVNAAINPLTALLDVPNGFLVENEAARAIMAAAAQEVAAVAQAGNVALPYPDAARQALLVATTTAANDSSMLQDLRRGAPTEIDAINGRPLPPRAEMLQTLTSSIVHRPS